MIERNNTGATLDRIFEEVYNMMSEASRIPMTDKIVIDENDLANALDELKAAIPKEVGKAVGLIEEQNKIVNRAYEEADKVMQMAKTEEERILGEARAKADLMLQENEIIKQANIAAKEVEENALRYKEQVMKDADEYAESIKNDVLKYADDMFEYLGAELQSAMQGLADNRNEIMKERQKNAKPC